MDGFSWRQPFDSLTKALEFIGPKVVIFIGPGHREQYSGKNPLRSGITIQGFGGDKDRPRFIFKSAEEYNEKDL